MKDKKSYLLFRNGDLSYSQFDWSSHSDDSDDDSYSEPKKGNRKPRLKHRTRQRIAANKRERSRMKVINKGKFLIHRKKVVFIINNFRL